MNDIIAWVIRPKKYKRKIIYFFFYGCEGVTELRIIMI
jgi:hypothetical protein